MEEKLTGVPETMLIPLWARATETLRDNPIIQDPHAVEMTDRIDYDFSRFESTWMSQVGVSIRTMLLDNAVRAYVDKHPGAVVVNLGSGLDTRVERLKDLDIFCWYDLDLPEGLAFREKFISESQQNKFIAKSAFDLSWTEEINLKGHPLLIIAEGLLMYFTEDEVRQFFKGISQRFPKSEMLFEALAPFIVGKSKKHDTVSKLENAPQFKWGLKKSKSLESWNCGIRFIEEWNYFDYHKDRWRWFRYLGSFPLTRPLFSNRIVHINFC